MKISSQKHKHKVSFLGYQMKSLVTFLESIQSNGDIFENDIPQHRWLFEL